MSNNIANITKVRDFMLEIGPEHFDMWTWFATTGSPYSLEESDQIDINKCGTTACIGGCAALVSGLRHVTHIADWLGLESNKLFYKRLWKHFGPIGLEASEMDDYDGALHLLNAAINGRVVL